MQGLGDCALRTLAPWQWLHLCGESGPELFALVLCCWGAGKWPARRTDGKERNTGGRRALAQILAKGTRCWGMERREGSWLHHKPGLKRDLHLLIRQVHSLLTYPPTHADKNTCTFIHSLQNSKLQTVSSFYSCSLSFLLHLPGLKYLMLIT